jgi:hypothetical protein
MQPPTTITQLVSSAKSKLVLALDTSASSLEKAFVNVLSAVMGGAYQTLWRYGSFSLLQQFGRFATYDEITVLGYTFRPLVEIGRRLNVDDPTDATGSQIELTCQVITPGGDLAPGELLSASDGRLFEVDEGVNDISGASITFTAISRDLAGLGDIASGELEFTKPVAGLSRVATVTDLISSGVEAETEEAYRQRVVEAEQTQPQGGNAADYRLWAEEVLGVVRAYPYTDETVTGVVNVHVLGGTAPDYIPGSTLLASVVDSIDADTEGRPRRPLNDAVNVLAITYATIAVHITGFTGDSDQEDELEDAIDKYLRSLRPWVQNLDVLPRQDIVSQGGVAGAAYEVAQNQGNSITTVTVDVNGDTAIGLYYLEFGEHAKLSSIDFL